MESMRKEVLVSFLINTFVCFIIGHLAVTRPNLALVLALGWIGVALVHFFIRRMRLECIS